MGNLRPSTKYKSVNLGKAILFVSTMANFVNLSTGWSFRDRDADEWLPVPAIPSVVQQDLIANKK